MKAPLSHLQRSMLRVEAEGTQSWAERVRADLIALTDAEFRIVRDSILKDSGIMAYNVDARLLFVFKELDTEEQMHGGDRERITMMLTRKLSNGDVAARLRQAEMLREMGENK